MSDARPVYMVSCQGNLSLGFPSSQKPWHSMIMFDDKATKICSETQISGGCMRWSYKGSEYTPVFHSIGMSSGQSPTENPIFSFFF